MLMADAMTGNDLLGNDMFGTMMLLNGMNQPPMMGMGAPPMGMMGGAGAYQPYAAQAAYAQPAAQAQTYYQPQSYSTRPSTGRKRGASQFGMMPGMGGMGAGM